MQNQVVPSDVETMNTGKINSDKGELNDPKRGLLKNVLANTLQVVLAGPGRLQHERPRLLLYLHAVGCGVQMSELPTRQVLKLLLKCLECLTKGLGDLLGCNLRHWGSLLLLRLLYAARFSALACALDGGSVEFVAAAAGPSAASRSAPSPGGGSHSRSSSWTGPSQGCRMPKAKPMGKITGLSDVMVIENRKSCRALVLSWA